MDTQNQEDSELECTDVDTETLLLSDSESDLILLNLLYSESLLPHDASGSAKDGETVGDAQYLRTLAIAA